MTPRTCDVDGCDGLHYGRGFCSKHYHRFLRSGQLLPLRERPTERRTHRTRVTPWRYV